VLISGFAVATTPNVLGGSIFEFVRRPSRISVAVVSDVAISAANLFTFQVGDTTICRDAQVFGEILATSGRQGPIYPDDFLIQNEPALAGDRLVLQILRGTGNLAWAVMVTEVA